MSIDPPQTKNPKVQPSILENVCKQARDFFRAMRCGHNTPPEAAEEWSRLEKEFEQREADAAKPTEGE